MQQQEQLQQIRHTQKQVLSNPQKVQSRVTVNTNSFGNLEKSK